MDEQQAAKVEELINNEAYQAAMDIIKAIPQTKLTDEDTFNMAICKVALNDIDGAIQDLQAMVRRGTDFPYTEYTLGQLYEKKGETEKAIYYYRHGMHHKETFEDAKQAYNYLHQQREVDDESARIIELKPFKSTTTFKDVVGLDEVKKILLKKVVLPIIKPEIYKRYGRDLSAGIVLYGAPGTGKTLLARAVGGETNCNMIVARSHQIEGEYVGVTQKNCNKLFTQARIIAPCIVFFDEFEVLGSKRSQLGGSDEHGGTSSQKQAVNALLEEMDGINKSPETLFIIAATNRPWDLDSAIKRPGRLETSIYVPPPTIPERAASFQYYLKDKYTDKKIDYNRLARATEGYTPADIRKLCNEAAEIPILENYEKNKERPIRMRDILQAIKKSKPSLNAWFMEARKELVGKYNIEIVDEKSHYSWKSASLEPQEMVDYKEMIDDVMKNTNPAILRRRAILRNLALYVG